MVGNERERFCGPCGKTVRNLSVLDGDEVLAVLARGDCVSFLYRQDASVITADSGAAGRTAPGATAAAVVLAATMALTLGCDASRTGDEPAPVTRVASETADEALQSRTAADSQGKQSGATATRPKAEAEASGAAASATADRAPRFVPTISKVKKPVEQVAPRELPQRIVGVLDPGF